MSRSRLLVGVAVVACAAAVALLALRSDTPAQAEDRGTDAALHPDPDRMQRQLEDLAAEVRRLRAAPARGAEGPADRSPTAPEAAPLPEEVGPPRDEVVRHSLERQLAGEPRDPAWAGETERAIRGALAGEALAGTSLIGADCRTTGCRIHVVHRDEAAGEAFAAEVAGTPPFDTEGVLWNAGTEEAPETILFIAREGDSLAIPR